MNCERAQALISARMDGEHVGRHAIEAVEAHAASCDRCRAFATGASRVRTAVRIRSAEPTPDLVDPIMAAVALDRRSTRPAAATVPTKPAPTTVPNGPAPATVPSRPRRSARETARSMRRPRAPVRRPASLAAAALVGALVGSVLVGGPWHVSSSRPPGAAAVARSIRGAAPALDAFSGSYVIHEFGLDPTVPERVLDMDVSYLAPQRFRLEIDDRTDYPSSSWTPTDLTFIENMPVTYRTGPTGCPDLGEGDLGPGVCPPTKTSISRVSEYSTAAPLPADLILPLATFGSARGVEVVGLEQVDGHETVHARMSLARAESLFGFLRLGGTWRPFYERDRVELWLDRETWAPERTVVYPADDPERRQWELRFGLPIERPSDAILEVDARTISEEAPDPSAFAIPGGAEADRVPLGGLEKRLGYVPAVPASSGGLSLASAVALPADADEASTSVLVYARGLEYLRVAQRPGWHGPRPFGLEGSPATIVRLPGGGVAYEEPEGEGFVRRLALHSDTTDLVLETNLPRSRLLEIASTIPVHGEPLA